MFKIGTTIPSTKVKPSKITAVPSIFQRIKEQIVSSKGKATPTKSQSFARKELIAEVEKFLSTDEGQYVGCVSITTLATPFGYRLESHLKEFIAMY